MIKKIGRDTVFHPVFKCKKVLCCLLLLFQSSLKFVGLYSYNPGVNMMCCTQPLHYIDYIEHPIFFLLLQERLERYVLSWTHDCNMFDGMTHSWGKEISSCGFTINRSPTIVGEEYMRIYFCGYVEQFKFVLFAFVLFALPYTEYERYNNGPKSLYRY